jgi:hypothetical protein
MNNNNMEKLLTLTPEQLFQEYKQIGSIQGVLKQFGISGKSKYVRDTCKKMIESFMPGSIKQHSVRSNYTLDDIRTAVEKSICMVDVLRHLNLTTHGTNAETLKRLIKDNGIDISHFDVIGSMARNKHRWGIGDVFKQNSPITRQSLRKNILKYKVMEYKCVLCGNEGTHNGKTLSLTVDHINGTSDDNRIENLRWLCPNCHSQTDNYCGKNKRK